MTRVHTGVLTVLQGHLSNFRLREADAWPKAWKTSGGGGGSHSRGTTVCRGIGRWSRVLFGEQRSIWMGYLSGCRERVEALEVGRRQLTRSPVPSSRIWACPGRILNRAWTCSDLQWSVLLLAADGAERACLKAGRAVRRLLGDSTQDMTRTASL